MQRLNCLPCRRRKSKCDRAEPCLSCVLRGTEAYCYTDLEPPAPQSRASASTSAASLAASLADTSHASLEDDNRPFKVRHVSTSNGSSGVGTSRGQGQQRSPGQPSQSLLERSFQAYKQLTEGNQEYTSSHNSVHKTLDSIEINLREVRRTVQAESQQRLLSSWGTIVPWSEARKLFPEPDEASAIFHCFFSELRWYVSSVDQEEFETTWARAEKGKEDLPRHRVALICVVMAFSLLLAPRAHPASRLPQKTTTDARWHVENARCLLDAHYQSPTHAEEEVPDSSWKDLGSQDEMIGQLEAETVYCYYCAVTGLFRKSFFALGRAVRLGLGLHLFDEVRWKVQGDNEVERQRCIAWDLIVMDRWVSGHLGIQSSFSMQPRVKCSTKEAGKATLHRNLMSDHVAKIVNYTNSVANIPMAERIEQCESLGRELEHFYNGIPEDLQYHRNDNNTSFDPKVARRASQALSYYLAILFLQAMRVRPFLMDAAAPPSLRFASLQYARKIIELRPQLISMTHNPWASHPPSWSLQFIFIASTMFASVLLSRDSASSGSPAEGRGATVAAAHANPSFWPNEDLDWFSDVIYDVSETFDLMAQGAKTNTARTCKRLFAGLCSSRETLRKRFQAREHERLLQAKGLRTEERLARNEVRRSSKRPHEATTGGNAGSQTAEGRSIDGPSIPAHSHPFNIHGNTFTGDEQSRNGVLHPPTSDSSSGPVPAGVVVSGLPNLYSGDAVPQSTVYGPQASSTPGFASAGFNSILSHSSSSLSTDAAVASSDFSTPPDFANSALDMLYLDPLEWAQLTAGLDANMDM